MPAWNLYAETLLLPLCCQRWAHPAVAAPPPVCHQAGAAAVAAGAARAAWHALAVPIQLCAAQVGAAARGGCPCLLHRLLQLLLLRLRLLIGPQRRSYLCRWLQQPFVDVGFKRKLSCLPPQPSSHSRIILKQAAEFGAAIFKAHGRVSQPQRLHPAGCRWGAISLG